MGRRGVAGSTEMHSCTRWYLQAQRSPCAHDPRERFDDRLLSQPLFDLGSKQADRVIGRVGGLVWPAVRHGIVGIDHADDLR